MALAKFTQGQDGQSTSVKGTLKNILSPEEMVASNLGVKKPKKRKRRAVLLGINEMVGDIYRPMAYETLG